MEKMLLNFRADEWLVTDLEHFRTQHPELDSTKDLVQNYIQSLRDKIVSLEATLQYQSDMAGKSVEAPVNSSFNQDSPTPTTEKESRPTSKPEIISPSDVQIVTVNGKACRISRTQTESAIWQDGQWTFSQKKAAALAFAKELEQVKTEGHEKRAQITVSMHRAIVEIHKKPPPLALNSDEPILKSPCPLSHSPSYCISTPCDHRLKCNQEGRINKNLINSPHGAPVADMVV